MQLSEDNRTTWNEFVAASPFGDVLQCWEWGELKARTAWEPLHFAVPDGDGYLATALVLKRPIPRTNRSLFYCPRGPIADFAHPEALAEILDAIRAGAREHRAIALKIDPALPAHKEDLVARVREAGLRPSPTAATAFGGVQPKAVMRVDLTPDWDELLAGFHKKWRYNIRLAARKGVVVRDDCSREDMDVFFDLLQVTARRDGFQVRSRSYFHDIWELLIERDLAKLFMAYAGDDPIAGAIAFVLGKQCWYVYGASADEHRNLMPNHLTQWEIMRWAKVRGCAVYDMRGVSPEVDGEPADERLAGLNRFKRGFGAQYVEYIGDWDLVFSPLWYGLFRRALPLARRFMSRGADAEAEE